MTSLTRYTYIDILILVDLGLHINSRSHDLIPTPSTEDERNVNLYECSILATLIFLLVIRNWIIRWKLESIMCLFSIIPDGPCPQPYQLNSSTTLPPCSPHKGFDYFSGNELPFISVFVCIGLFPFSKLTFSRRVTHYYVVKNLKIPKTSPYACCTQLFSKFN